MGRMVRASYLVGVGDARRVRRACFAEPLRATCHACGALSPQALSVGVDLRVRW